jgi:GNAT superfamily N-acetyltransferase
MSETIIGHMETVVSYLEMFAPPKSPPVQPPGQGVEVVRALDPTVSFYRYLYDNVGGDWLWNRRRTMPRDELQRIIVDPGNDLRVLWKHGNPAGMAEFDFRDPGNVELAYFGLIPEFIGQGLGRFLIDWACRHAFAKGARRFWVHTCDLDHPRALDNYERAGFELYDRETALEPIPASMRVPDHATGRPVLPA